jgi:hypothetical protein
MNKPTALQFNLMSKIIEDEYTEYNGNALKVIEDGTHGASCTWAFQILETAQDKGTFTSLLNANLAWHEDEGKESKVGLTESGLAVMKEFYNK